MKILAISNVEGCSERVADALEHIDASIIARDEQGGIDALQEKVAEALGRKTYDYIVVVSNDHVGAAILFNKLQGVRAALCETKEDMLLAKRNNANVILARAEQKRFEYIAEGILQWPDNAKKETRARAAEVRKREEKQGKEEQAPEKGREEDEDDEPESDGKGIIGKLKNQLGIVD